MSDSKKPPSREEFEQLREAFAAQAELIDEYLPDDPEKRKFLGQAAKGVGAVGALGIAGQSGYVVGQASAEASTSDTDTDIGSPSNRHDVFAEGVDANSASARDLNRNASYREGTTVVYDSRDSGPYVDGQDALADVPPGGTLRLAATEYDVANEGRLLADTKTINIEGEGWGDDSHPVDEGTVIVNTGADVVDSPVVELSESGGPQGGGVRNLAIRHEGGTSPAILVNGVTESEVHNVIVDCISGAGHSAVKTQGDAFYFSATNVWARSFASKGFDIQGNGSDYSLWGSHAFTSTSGAIGADIQVDGARIYSGEYGVGSASGDTGSGIRFGGGVVGGTVVGPNIEGYDKGINLADGAASTSYKITLYQPRLHLNTLAEGVRFGNCFNSQVVFPEIVGSNGELYHWTIDSSLSGALHGGGSDKSRGYTDDGATSPYIYYPVGMTDGQISGITTGVPIGVAMRISNNREPAFHDGTSWRNASSTTFTP